MLELLRIRNLALIEDMELEFDKGMNVLTGETGAGKSFILKALAFLLGEKLSVQMVRPGAERAEVTGLFITADGELIIRRELSAASGRSRLYLNDVLTSQESVRSWRSKLILHTSQHAQQQLLQSSYQASLIEGNFTQPALLEKKESLLKELQEVASHKQSLQKKFAALAERRDLLEMQQQEISKVAPEAGEEEELEAQRAAARDTEFCKKNYESALLLLHGDEGPGLLDLLGNFEHIMHSLIQVDSSLTEDAAAVSALRQNLSHLSGRLRRPPAMEQEIDLEQVEARLFELAQLKRKLHRSLDEILTLQTEVEENISFLDSCQLDITHLQTQEDALCQQLRDILAVIIPARREAGDSFAAALEQELRQLGFSEKLQVCIEYVPHEIWPSIMDERPRILWAPNPGQPPQPLEHIASGGELSRFLLALVSLRQTDACATLIFDEVDAGVGGLTLNRVADKLAALAEQRQMLLITHWPQLAVCAKRHFFIQKTIVGQETFTLCTQLDPAARQDELVRMAGGGAQGKALAQTLVHNV